MYEPSDVGLPISPADDRHSFHDLLLKIEATAAPQDESDIRQLRAQYFGMISSVDEQMGRLWKTLRDLDQWDNTIIIVTADHGEQLGDHGLVQKVAWFEESHHIPMIIRDPSRPHAHGNIVKDFTDVTERLLIFVAEPQSKDGASDCAGRVQSLYEEWTCICAQTSRHTGDS
jgi:arylsulfatase A-like enzyme